MLGYLKRVRAYSTPDGHASKKVLVEETNQSDSDSGSEGDGSHYSDASNGSFSSDEPPGPPDDTELDQMEERMRNLLSEHSIRVEEKLEETVNKSREVRTLLLSV